MPSVESLSPDRNRLREQIVGLPVLMEQSPKSWWRGAARFIIGMKRRVNDFQDEGLRKHILSSVDMAEDLLRHGAQQSVHNQGEIVGVTEHLLMDMSIRMAQQFEPKELQLPFRHVSLEELVAVHPDRLRVEDQKIEGIACKILQVKHPSQDLWQSIPLPVGEKIWHKGGPARAIMDVYADSPESMQASEYPFNDFDVVTAGTNHQRTREIAHAIGVDPDGVEMTGEKELNFVRFCYGRDTEQNQVLLGADGLYFSEPAYTAAQTGHVNITGEYIASKAIYGIDKISVGGVDMVKPRGLMRLLKCVAEGKALSFDFKPVNANFDMGVYILFLAKKWAKKPNFSELLEKSYYILQQMGQVRDNEMDIMDVLERAHKENPFFDFNREIKTTLDVMRWKSRKFVKQYDREAAWLFSFPTTLKLVRTPGDEDTRKISLEGFTGDKEKRQTYRERWETFLAQSHARTEEFEAHGVSAMQKLFPVGSEYVEEETPESLDEE